MITPDTMRSVIVEREMAHPPEKIWRALTQGALIEEWLMQERFPASGRARFSFRATPVPKWNGVIDCEVLVVEPHARLAYSWGRWEFEKRGHVDIDADDGRHACAHGAIRIRGGRGCQL